MALNPFDPNISRSEASELVSTAIPMPIFSKLPSLPSFPIFKFPSSPQAQVIEPFPPLNDELRINLNLGLAASLSKKGDHKRVVQIVERALQTNPADEHRAALLYRLASSHYHLQNYSQTTAAAIEGLKMGTGNSHLNGQLSLKIALVCLRAKDYDAGINAIETGILANPVSKELTANLYLARSLLHLKKGELELAHRDALLSIEFDKAKAQLPSVKSILTKCASEKIST